MFEERSLRGKRGRRRNACGGLAYLDSAVMRSIEGNMTLRRHVPAVCVLSRIRLLTGGCVGVDSRPSSVCRNRRATPTLNPSTFPTESCGIFAREPLSFCLQLFSLRRKSSTFYREEQAKEILAHP